MKEGFRTLRARETTIEQTSTNDPASFILRNATKRCRGDHYSPIKKRLRRMLSGRCNRLLSLRGWSVHELARSQILPSDCATAMIVIRSGDTFG
jgi:hypothetical protein